MKSDLKLNVLDQSPIRDGGTARQAVAETIALAKATEALGYHRYWVAEHHNSNSFAGSVPEVLIARLAHETETIRVGSGGVMLPHYSPLKVAETFRMLETLSPGRIDLGIGRAPGTDGKTMAALQPGPQAYPITVFPQQLALLREYLMQAGGSDHFRPDHPLHGIHAMPRGEGMPELWLLGSSIETAAFAGAMGMAFCYAKFIVGTGTEAALQTYRDAFEPSATLESPLTSVGVSVLCAETEEEAERYAASRSLWLLRFLNGRFGPFPSDEDAAAYPFSETDRAQIESFKNRGITGTPSTVKAELDDLVAKSGADELTVVTITHDFAPRLRSYELLADLYL